ncbi:hypothetical protein [Glutamicibacter sp. X7]
MSQSEMTLREITPSDADFIYLPASDARVTAFVGDGQPWSEEFTMQRLNQVVQDDHIYWLLALVADRFPDTDLLARVHEQNTASLKLLERRGFRRCFRLGGQRHPLPAHRGQL